MELNEVFKNGANKGQTLEEVWRGTEENLTFQFVQEITSFISGKMDKNEKIYSPNFNDDSIETDFSYIIKNPNLFKIICTQEYIIFESNQEVIVKKLKKVFMTILRGAYTPYPNNYFKPAIHASTDCGFSNGSKAILKMIGKPNYIQYCMQNWDDFFISTEDLNYLMTKHKPLKMSMEVNEIAYNVLSYKPIFEEYDFKFHL